MIMSHDAFTIYIFHPMFVKPMDIMFRPLSMDPS